MKKFVTKKKVVVTLMGLVIILAGLFIFQSLTKKTPATEPPKNLKLWVLTDNHLIAPELYDDGSEFSFIESTAAGKDLRYQKQSLQALVDKALKEKPDEIVLTGDLTLNGEYISAQKLVELLTPLTEKKIKVRVIPGNHDIHDGWARKYQDDKQLKTKQISPDDFRDLFKDMGYNGADNYDKHSLSYKEAGTSEYDFYFLDSNQYTLEPSKSAPATGGRFREETMAWLEAEFKKTVADGKRPIVFMHHNLYPHNAGVSRGFVINDVDKVQTLYAKYHVAVVFSGHIHAQDILEKTIDGVTIPEIVTSSYSIIDHGFGEVAVSEQGIEYTRKTIDVDSWAKETDQIDPKLLEHQAYLRKLFVKDGEALAYGSLLDKDIPNEKDLDAAAQLVGQLNEEFFTGKDARTPEEIAQIKEGKAYQTLEKYDPFLKKYIDSVLTDNNLEDTHLFIEK
ncbi:hypothetical protein IGI37_002516 [Enterococcus sp. AZ194]|uniref:metallophosphoesterase n=1 Tax=Enterococcus sp. AZ194 TaxID=2774629 RepID=UPI003F214874